MALPGVHLNVRKGPFDETVDVELVKLFAAATKDPSERARCGEAVPPVALMPKIWDAQMVGRDEIINQEVRNAAAGGAHGQHDLVLHRPLVPGERLRSWVEGWGARPAARNALCTLYFPTFDERDELVAEQWWSFIFVDTTCEVTGRALPDHEFPADARDRPVGSYDLDLDADLPRRYAEATNDWAPVHFDLEIARKNGFPGMTAHGLSSLAICSQGIVAQFADGDPARVRRLAGRFSAPALLGKDLHVDIYDAGPGAYAFEAECAGIKVITHGRMELRA